MNWFLIWLVITVYGFLGIILGKWSMREFPKKIAADTALLQECFNQLNDDGTSCKGVHCERCNLLQRLEKRLRGNK